MAGARSEDSACVKVMFRNFCRASACLSTGISIACQAAIQSFVFRAGLSHNRFSTSPSLASLRSPSSTTGVSAISVTSASKSSSLLPPPAPGLEGACEFGCGGFGLATAALATGAFGTASGAGVGSSGGGLGTVRARTRPPAFGTASGAGVGSSGGGLGTVRARTRPPAFDGAFGAAVGSDLATAPTAPLPFAAASAAAGAGCAGAGCEGRLLAAAAETGTRTPSCCARSMTFCFSARKKWLMCSICRLEPIASAKRTTLRILAAPGAASMAATSSLIVDCARPPSAPLATATRPPEEAGGAPPDFEAAPMGDNGEPTCGTSPANLVTGAGALDTMPGAGALPTEPTGALAIAPGAADFVTTGGADDLAMEPPRAALPFGTTPAPGVFETAGIFEIAGLFEAVAEGLATGAPPPALTMMTFFAAGASPAASAAARGRFTP
mmetsp:Transcript_17592/g.61499  ORF Transcript_17592/g.61499 Transcript_17592/m.61499 type:complete len:440 (-) Transcript_17592:187-1506(-)